MNYQASSRPGIPSPAVTDALLASYGIVRVPTYVFEYGGYRYTHVDDALAEAKRRTPPDQLQEPAPEGDSRWEEGGEA